MCVGKVTCLLKYYAKTLSYFKYRNKEHQFENEDIKIYIYLYSFMEFSSR